MRQFRELNWPPLFLSFVTPAFCLFSCLNWLTEASAWYCKSGRFMLPWVAAKTTPVRAAISYMDLAMQAHSMSMARSPTLDTWCTDNLRVITFPCRGDSWQLSQPIECAHLSAQGLCGCSAPCSFGHQYKGRNVATRLRYAASSDSQ